MSPTPNADAYAASLPSGGESSGTSNGSADFGGVKPDNTKKLINILIKLSRFRVFYARKLKKI